VRYAAFLRAINVGKHNRIKMTELREVLVAAGLKEPRTYLQTGNVLFESEDEPESIALQIESALVAHGLRNAPAVVRSQDELTALLAVNPFSSFDAEEYRFYVTLFRNPIAFDTQESAQPGLELFSVREREILSAVRKDGVPQGLDINGTLSKQSKAEGTTRYWHVIEEVARLLAVS